MSRPAALLILLALSGCDGALPVEKFATEPPTFDPVTFWTGHTQSWGVLEDRGGQPTDVVRTDCVGTAEGADGLHMVQTLTMGDGTVSHRDWHMRRATPGRFEATANDMVGTATGEAAGRAFHWQWTLALKPNDPIRRVTMDQWMYAYPDGSMMNHTTIRKLGVVLAGVSERFVRVGG